MRAVLEGRDSVVVLPTGGGKSLCYQAPAMCLEGTAVVVSPALARVKAAIRERDAESRVGAWARVEGRMHVARHL